MDSRENFMEYVRNLEKGGGPGYMWQVARLHLAELSKPAATPPR